MNWFETKREDYPSPVITVDLLNQMFEEAYGDGHKPNMILVRKRTYERMRHYMKRRPAPRYCMKARKRMHRG